MWLYILWFLLLLVALGRFMKELHKRFTDYGVKVYQPGITGLKVLLKMEHIADAQIRMYKELPGEKFFGQFEFTKVSIVIRDLELLKKITVKDFDHFFDHINLIDGNADPLFSRGLFSLKGQEWRDMRSTLSPAFTSSKIRHMVPFMMEVGEQMMKSLTAKCKESKSSMDLDIDVKDLTTKYTNDVIASIAFGLKLDSFSEPDNLFYKRVKEASALNFKQLLVFIGYALAPSLMKTFGVSIFSKESQNFYRTLVKSNMEHREKNNIIRPDMLQMLMEAKKGKLTYEESSSTNADAGFAAVEESSIGKKIVNREWSDDDITAQAVGFIMAGFEAVASTTSFLLHEVALNPEVQEKLYQEIMENDSKNNGQFNYNSIQDMTYMDMVLSEVLRLWPAAVQTDRKCMKDYNCGKANANAKDFTLRKGEFVTIPIWSIHHDPEYFPNPEKFDPERFSDENKHKIHPYSYMPFGLGPRNCIGSRFALCEVKVITYQLLKHMKLSPAEKTQIPAKLATDAISMRIQGGHWVRLTPRETLLQQIL